VAEHPLVECPNCRAEIPPTHWLNGRPVRCGQCGQTTVTWVLPSLVEGVPPEEPGERLVDADSAGCFYHPDRRAEYPCDHCGRFVCRLCDLDLGPRRLCPSCLEGARNGENDAIELESQRLLYEDVAFLMAGAPLLLGFCFWYMWIVTAPAAIFMAIWSWRRPGKAFGRPKAKRVLTILLALLQILLWVFKLRHRSWWMYSYFD
jgi:hypothetical protein